LVWSVFFGTVVTSFGQEPGASDDGQSPESTLKGDVAL
jgi:hypothetical protein